MYRLVETADSLITPPAIEPIEVREAKTLLRFQTDAEDGLIETWIADARQQFESQTGRQLLTATWEYWLSDTPRNRAIELPHPPLQAVSSVKYEDSNGDTQTMDPSLYVQVAPQGPHCRRGWIELIPSAQWPTLMHHAKALRIRYTAGYGDAQTNVPEIIKGALYLLIGLRHKFRSEVHEGRSSIPIQIPLGAEPILKTFKDSAIAQMAPLVPLGGTSWDSHIVPFYTGDTWPF